MDSPTSVCETKLNLGVDELSGLGTGVRDDVVVFVVAGVNRCGCCWWAGGGDTMDASEERVSDALVAPKW